ncbi:MAG: Ig-like domain repeat protein [Terracidiphilus sp.]|jgi:hypothetical protein
MQALSLRAAMCGSALLCPILFASTAVFAQMDHVSAPTAKPAITLVPSATPIERRDGEASFENAPANFHAFASVHLGDVAVAEPLTLKFGASTQITKIELTKDFVMDAGSTCQVGNRYSEGDSCTLLVRFTPQGAGRRLGKATITHTASVEPLALGLGGNGYAPVISFTPAVISTVSGTYPSSKGLLSGATNLYVDGGDVLYLADTGNSLIRQIDSSGTITNTTPVAPPQSVAVDGFGSIYTVSPGKADYFSYYESGGTYTFFFGPYTPGTCTVSAPCSFGEVGASHPGSITIDSNNNLFMEESTEGAMVVPVGGVEGGGVTYTIEAWYLADSFAPFYNSPTGFAVDAEDNLYTAWNYGTSACDIVMEPLYEAETGIGSYTRVAGASKCGFSGDGGQARDAEIGAPIGQIFFDIAGNMYFSDTENQRVRRVDSQTGQINTIAGAGVAGYSGDGSQATNATLSSPTGVGVDSQGQVYIISSATSGQVVRKLGPNGFLAFGAPLKGTSSTAHVVTVANTGNDPMVLTQAYISGTNPGDFAIDPDTTSCDLTAHSALVPGQSCKIGIIFTPAAGGARSGSLILLDNTVTSMNTVQFTGTGTLPTPTFSMTAPASAATETSGTAFTFSVSVTSSSGPQPTGKVTMLLNGAAISGSPVTLNGSGVASLSVASTTTGANTLSATYGGDTNYAADGPITRSITVNSAAVKIQPEVAVASSANPATACSAISFSFTVSGTSGETPTGTVKLMNGTDLIGNASLTNGAGTLPGVHLAAGTNVLTAQYSGDTTHESSTSSPFKQVVSEIGCAVLREPDRPVLPLGPNLAR